MNSLLETKQDIILLQVMNPFFFCENYWDFLTFFIINISCDRTCSGNNNLK